MIKKHLAGEAAAVSESALLPDSSDGGTREVDVVIQGAFLDSVTSASAAGRKWLATHASVVNGKTVLDVGGEQRTLPSADLSQLLGA